MRTREKIIALLVDAGLAALCVYVWGAPWWGGLILFYELRILTILGRRPPRA